MYTALYPYFSKAVLTGNTHMYDTHAVYRASFSDSYRIAKYKNVPHELTSLFAKQ